MIAWTSQPLPEEVITFATGRDITVLKKIEMELESHRQHLESLVDERTIELKRTNEKMAVEITERNHVEEALRASEEWLSTTLKSIGDAVIATDAKGHVRLINPVAQTLTGWNEEDAIGKPLEDVFNIINEETGKPAEDPATRVIREGIIVGLANHTVLIAKDGTQWPVDDSGAPIRDDKGNITGVILVFRDVTERKRMEEEIRRSRDRYVQAEEIANLGHFERVYAEDEAIWSQGNYRNFGVKPGQFTPTRENLLNVVHPSDKAAVINNMEALKSGSGKPDVEYRITRPDGNERILHSIGEVTFDEDGKPQKIVGVTQDITERKQLEKNLGEEKERLEVTLRSTGDGVIATDMEGKITIVNRVAENLTGWTQEEAVGKPLEEVFHVVDERTHRRIRNPVQTVLKTGRVVGLINHAMLISRDGTERIIADSGAPIHDEEGNLFGVVLVFRDITEIRRLEEELRKLDKLESLGTLAGGIAHDFNNLLTGIMGNISLAKRYVEPKSKAEDRLLEAEKASFRARDLTQQLLTFASGGAPIKKMASIAEIIKETADFALRGSNVKCEFSLPDDIWPAEVDGGQISQVINNLVINADEAMPKGGTIEIGANNIVIRRRRKLPLATGNYVEVTVQDHGVGIPKGELDKNKHNLLVGGR